MVCANGGKLENPEKTLESSERPNNFYSHEMPGPGIGYEIPEVIGRVRKRYIVLESQYINTEIALHVNINNK